MPSLPATPPKPKPPKEPFTCRHCGVPFYADWTREHIRGLMGSDNQLSYQFAYCAGCEKPNVALTLGKIGTPIVWYPRDVFIDRAPKEVTKSIRDDYSEACKVISISPKASAALSRRCLQNILDEKGYTGDTLYIQISKLLSDDKIPSDIHDSIDAIRNFGNFSAHPITEINQTQIIDVEPEEAEWCLEILRDLFDHFYVKPAKNQAKIDALNAKLSSAGKPPAKK